MKQIDLQSNVLFPLTSPDFTIPKSLEKVAPRHEIRWDVWSPKLEAQNIYSVVELIELLGPLFQKIISPFTAVLKSTVFTNYITRTLTGPIILQ